MNVSVTSVRCNFFTKTTIGVQAGVNHLLFGGEVTHFTTAEDRQVKMENVTDSAKSRWAKLVLLGVILGAALVGAFTLGDVLSFEALRDNREALIGFRDANYAATVVVFILLYVVIVGLSLPGGTVATLTGGFLFGTFPGVLFNVCGATLGAVVIFLAARWGLGRRLAAKMEASEGRIKAIKDGIDENQWSMLFLIRLVPAVPFFVANLIPALVGVPLWRYAVSTFFGIMPAAVVFTSIGAGLGEVFARGETPDLGVIFEPHILLPILGLCGLAVLPILLRALRGREAL